MEGKNTDGEKEGRENETLWIVRSLFAMEGEKRGEGGESGQETDTVILINGVCRVINVRLCVYWPVIFLRRRGNSESTGISGLPFCLLIYLRGCKVSRVWNGDVTTRVSFFFFFFFFLYYCFRARKSPMDSSQGSNFNDLIHARQIFFSKV